MIEILIPPIFSLVLSACLKDRQSIPSILSVILSLLLFISLNKNWDFVNSFFVILCIITLMVFLYSHFYIKKRKRWYWFFMNLFFLSMSILIISSNIFLIILAWELLGFCSWALISWKGDDYSIKRARRAFIIVSISDIFLIISFGMILVETKAIFGKYIFDFSKLPRDFLEKSVKRNPMIAIFFILAVLGKSAQLPFSMWLMDAMAGPSTVSALLHSSTMVKAGVILSLKFFPIVRTYSTIILAFSIPSLILFLILAVLERKIKKLLAFSTIANLSLMFTSLALGFSKITFLHMIAHAFFKAPLFLLVPFLSDRDIYKTKIKMPKRDFLPVLLSFVGVPPFLSYFTESFVMDVMFPYTIPVSFLLHFYSMRLLMILLSRDEERGKLGFEGNIIRTFSILNVLLIFLSFQIFEMRFDIIIIPLALILSYYLYWKKNGYRIENLLEKIHFPRLEIVKDVLRELSTIDKKSPRELIEILVIMLLLFGVMLWFL